MSMLMTTMYCAVHDREGRALRDQLWRRQVGFDKQLASNVRFRLTGSMYANGQSASNTLYTGDRAGSRCYDVLENTTSTETANAWSGAIRPGFGNNVHAYVVTRCSSPGSST